MQASADDDRFVTGSKIMLRYRSCEDGCFKRFLHQLEHLKVTPPGNLLKLSGGKFKLVEEVEQL